jgi:LCP family protein required for cell wall assembly
VKLLVALLSIAILLASVGGYAVVTWFNGSINRVQITYSANRPGSAPAGSENWLLVGTDSRAGTNGEYGTGVEGQRSDTTILAHLDGNGTTTMVSFPRDTLVEIPQYRDPKTRQIVPAHMDKFNSAIMEGGASLLIETVENMTDIKIDHYVSVDLEGFSDISKALNGVEVCILPTPPGYSDPEPGLTNINDGYSGFHGIYGKQKVAGQSAVAFVRQRHGLPDGDIDRIKRQQQFLGSVFRAASQTGVLFNPVAITRLLTSLNHALTLDQDTSLTDLEKLAVRLRGVGTNQLFFETIPQRFLSYDDTDLGTVFEADGILQLTPKGQDKPVGSVQILEKAPFEAMMAKLKNEAPTTVAPSATPSVTPSREPVPVNVPPANVLVTVEDGVGKAGLAQTVTTSLAKDGFRTGAPGPADRTGYATSVVRYGAGEKEVAETVAAAVPGSKLVQDPSVTGGVVLVVGANFKEVRAVALSDVPVEPTETPSTTPSAPSSSPTVPPAVSANDPGNRCTY